MFNSIFENKILNSNSPVLVMGLNDKVQASYVWNLFGASKKNILVVTNTLYEANMLYKSLNQYDKDNILLFPMDDFLVSEAVATSPDLMSKRIETLNELAKNNIGKIVITNFMGYLRFLPSRKLWSSLNIKIKETDEINRDLLIQKLNMIGYKKDSIVTKTGEYANRGYILDVFPYGYENPVRIEFFDDEIERITEIDTLTGEVKRELEHVAIFPNSHYVIPPERMEGAIKAIEAELAEQVAYFKSEDKLIEAQRIAERTNFDMEMLRETGICSGIENYSRHMAGLEPGATPHTLMEYFGDDFLTIVDESHITLPQVRGMYNGDQSRKTTLVNYGFRLPSAKDNRPLKFEEFEGMIDQMLFVSATPNVYEEEHELLRAEQIIRPTGLLDPKIDVRPVKGQIDDLVSEINKEVEKKNKILVTTLTKRMAEDLTDYMKDVGIRVKYLHSDIDTLERTEIIRDMRLDVFDVLVGINLLREGLDIPEISLVAILDADKEGFLRSETSLIQTIGSAARNSEGHVIMYADSNTESMDKAISETNRRREIQEKYNKENGITPTTIKKAVRDLISISKEVDKRINDIEKDPESMDKKELKKLMDKVEKKMQKAAAELDFETAIEMREKLAELKLMYNK